MNDKLKQLSRREREIMEVVYREGRASVAEVRELMTEPPSYSAVRTTMGILADKGLLSHRKKGRRFIYEPVLPAGTARRQALRNVVSTFFGGSAASAAVALLDSERQQLDEADLDRLEAMIRKARGQEELQ